MIFGLEGILGSEVRSVSKQMSLRCSHCGCVVPESSINDNENSKESKEGGKNNKEYGNKTKNNTAANNVCCNDGKEGWGREEEHSDTCKS